ncbi:MAG TPA: hypothetical protein VGM05_09595 [Planctomycetaceae bacterium]
MTYILPSDPQGFSLRYPGESQLKVKEQTDSLRECLQVERS